MMCKRRKKEEKGTDKRWRKTRTRTRQKRKKVGRIE